MEDATTYTPAPKRRGRPPKAETAPIEATETAKPVRETRAEATRRERRRRSDGLEADNAGMKLSVPSALKQPGFTYRWVNDTAGGRVKALYEQDWDVVSDQRVDGQGEGTVVKRNLERESPLQGVLMKKPLDFHKEDRAKAQERLKETEEAMMRGPVSRQGGLNPAESYVPHGHVNRIERG